MVKKQQATGDVMGVAQKEYGAAYKEHALEVYKTYLEMTDRNSARRATANSFFLAVNTALIALLAKDPIPVAISIPKAVELLIPIVGIVNCYLWYRMIRSYRDLNTAKFKVIQEIEKTLPFRPYAAEWQAVGEGRNYKLFLPFTHVEGAIPWLFLVFFGVILAAAIPWGVAMASFFPNQ